MSDPTGRGDPILETQLVAPATFAAPAAAPLGVGPVLSRTLRAWWAHALAFSAMSLVVYAPLVVAIGLFLASLTTFANRVTPTPDERAALALRGGLLALAGVATLVLSIVQMGAVTYGTVQFLHGERARLGRMLAVGLRRGLPVVGTGLVVWTVSTAGLLLLVVPGVMFLVAACVAVPAAVVERIGVEGAVRRSFALTRGSRWRLFAAGLAVVVVMWLLSAIVQVGVALLAVALPPAKAMALAFVASQLGSAVFSVLPVVAVAVCYHDLRLAKEGVDTAELARVFE